MADASIAQTISQAVQDALEAHSGAIATQDRLNVLAVELGNLEVLTTRIYMSTTTTLDDIPETAARGRGLVVLTNSSNS